MDPQRMLKGPGKLLDREGNLADVGWSRFPVLDCNLEDCHFYTLPTFQGLRIKVWDYYAITTPTLIFHTAHGGHFKQIEVDDVGIKILPEK